MRFYRSKHLTSLWIIISMKFCQQTNYDTLSIRPTLITQSYYVIQKGDNWQLLLKTIWPNTRLDPVSMKSVKSTKPYDRKTFFPMNSSCWNPHELPVLPSSKIVSRKEITVSAELTDNWVLNENLLRTFLRRVGFLRILREREMKIKK